MTGPRRALPALLLQAPQRLGLDAGLSGQDVLDGRQLDLEHLTVVGRHNGRCDLRSNPPLLDGNVIGDLGGLLGHGSQLLDGSVVGADPGRLVGPERENHLHLAIRRIDPAQQ